LYGGAVRVLPWRAYPRTGTADDARAAPGAHPGNRPGPTPGTATHVTGAAEPEGPGTNAVAEGTVSQALTSVCGAKADCALEDQTMHLSHLGLPVRDVRRSLDFYEVHFGFDRATARSYPDGTVIVRNQDRFDLALHPADAVTSQPEFLHFGFAMPDADRVRAMLARLTADGVPIVESDDEPGYVAFKCLDPDRWRIEVYREQIPSGG
jgi:catechol 2,3-dioxygenase-like lactoylglutathione lyase family enzyme